MHTCARTVALVLALGAFGLALGALISNAAADFRTESPSRPQSSRTRNDDSGNDNTNLQLFASSRPILVAFGGRGASATATSSAATSSQTRNASPQSSKSVRFSTPTNPVTGQTIPLKCHYELKGEPLHAMKVFKDDKEVRIAARLLLSGWRRASRLTHETNHKDSNDSDDSHNSNNNPNSPPPPQINAHATRSSTGLRPQTVATSASSRFKSQASTSTCGGLPRTRCG